MQEALGPLDLRADRRQCANEHRYTKRGEGDKAKSDGIARFPSNLARLVVERAAALISGWNEPLRVLDPACGDGNA